MALFAGKLKQEVADLNDALADAESELQAALASHAQTITTLTTTLTDTQKQLDSRLTQIVQMGKDYATGIAALKQANEIAVASLRGQVEVLQAKGAKWDAIILPWQWHGDGSVEIEGQKYQRQVARADNPLADFAVGVPDGVEFP